MHELIHPLRVRVHDGREGPIADVLRLIERGAAPGALDEILESLCERVSAILNAPVASMYVRAPAPAQDDLVMRANVGLPATAVGRIRLRMGEGITGFAAECLRPVSVDAGPHHDRYMPVPDIGEEAFPCYLAVPLVQGGRALGVMVLQRSADAPFDTKEVLLATALAAPFAHALELASARTRSPGAPARDVILSGTGESGGRGWGAARFLPTLDALVEDRPLQRHVGQALDVVTRELARSARRIVHRLGGHAAMALGGLVPLLMDQRLRARIQEACAAGGMGAGLQSVAKAYARVPYRATASDQAAAEWLADRAQDVEDLCLLVAAHAAAVTPLRAGDVLAAGDRVGGVMALAVSARRVSAVVVGQPVAEGDLAAAILCAAGIPMVSNVAGMLDWARPGDTLLVDADAAQVRVNPAPRHLARVRASA